MAAATGRVAAAMAATSAPRLSRHPSNLTDLSDNLAGRADSSSNNNNNATTGSGSRRARALPATDGEQRPFVDSLPAQAAVRRAMGRPRVQLAVAAVIALNFLVNTAEAQLRPRPDDAVLRRVFALFEFAFTLVFAVELLCNLYGSFYERFCLGRNRWWNFLDVFVVVTSVMSIASEGTGGLSVLRVFRALRVLRLFSRFPNLRIVIEGVMATLPGVCNAMTVLTLVMGVWAVIGVELFASYMDQEFGTFLKALFTMWQLLTMDSWASGIARELIFVHDLPLASLYFVLYTFVAGIVVTNVVVAVMLEGYLTATQAIEEDQEVEAERRERRLRRLTSMREHGMLSGDADELRRLVLDAIARESLRKFSRQQIASLLNELWANPATGPVMARLTSQHLQARAGCNATLVEMLGETSAHPG